MTILDHLNKLKSQKKKKKKRKKIELLDKVSIVIGTALTRKGIPRPFKHVVMAVDRFRYQVGTRTRCFDPSNS